MTRKIFIGLTSCFLLFLVFCALPAQAQPKKQDKKQMEVAKGFLAEGDNFYRQKNYRAAIEKYDKATTAYSNYPIAYFSKGFAHFNLGEYDQAIEDLSTALQQGYTPPVEVYRLRGQAYFNKKNY